MFTGKCWNKLVSHWAARRLVSDDQVLRWKFFGKLTLPGWFSGGFALERFTVNLNAVEFGLTIAKSETLSIAKSADFGNQIVVSADSRAQWSASNFKSTFSNSKFRLSTSKMLLPVRAYQSNRFLYLLQNRSVGFSVSLFGPKCRWRREGVLD